MSVSSRQRRAAAAPVPSAAPAAPDSSPWMGWAAALAIVVAGVTAYWGARNAPFVFDDIPAVVENQSIRDLGQIGRVLNPPADGAGVDSRPIVNLSLALNYAMSGLNPFVYHLTNVAIHLVAALLLFGLVRRTCALPSSPAFLRERAHVLGWGVALLWVAHPLTSETVICVIQRTESLVSFFYLLVLYAFVRGAAPKGRAGWFGLAVFAAFAGMLSKEVMATAPIVVFLFDRTFVAGTFAGAWRQRGRWHLALGASWLVLAVLVWNSGGHRGGTVGYGQGLTAWGYLLTQARAIMTYLKLSFWPHPLLVDYGTWRARDFAEVAPEFLTLAGLVVLTLYALWRWPRAGFVGATFFAILGPSSSIYPLLTQTMAEHRMYLPLAAVLTLSIVMAGRWLGARTLAGGVALLAVAAVVTTMRRGADYATEEILWTDLIAKTPENPWAYFNLAKMHFRQGHFEEAERLNREAVRLMPENPDMHLAWGISLEKRGQPAPAAEAYRESLRLKPAQPKVLFRLGMVLLKGGRPELARQSFAEALALVPDDFDTAGNLAVALLQLGRFHEAEPYLRRLLTMKPDSVDAHYNLAYVLGKLGQKDEALTHFETAVRLAPTAADLHAAHAEALGEAGRWSEARTACERSLELQPNQPVMELALGNALLQLGQAEDARRHLERALQLDPSLTAARQLLERIR